MVTTIFISVNKMEILRSTKPYLSFELFSMCIQAVLPLFWEVLDSFGIE